ncbi:MAG: metallophosphoesterase family protein [Syntrophales bacterium]|nr:metallophosphoesterase family protein [Syntrophales bacterium]
MKIAITADVHLRSKERTPNRYDALDDIFQTCTVEGIGHVFILGDLFDKDFNNCHDFDELCSTYKELRITVLPGNHDVGIKQKSFSSKNVRIIEEPCRETVGGIQAVFFPYSPFFSLDEAIQGFMIRNKLQGKFVIFGHGDWISGARLPNVYEEGVYMPLTRRILEKFLPLRVFLGHIHQPDPAFDRKTRVNYPGSPCGLDINETGKRRFLIYDTDSDELESRGVETSVIYFKEELLVIPLDNEETWIKEKIDKMLKNWNLSDGDLKKVRLKLQVRGFTRDKGKLSRIISDEITNRGINFYDASGADFSELNVSDDETEVRILLLKKLHEKIQQTDLSRFLTSDDDVIKEAAEIIFGMR